jgi:hypothetical protein
LLELIHMHGSAVGEDSFCEIIYQKKQVKFYWNLCPLWFRCKNCVQNIHLQPDWQLKACRRHVGRPRRSSYGCSLNFFSLDKAGEYMWRARAQTRRIYFVYGIQSFMYIHTKCPTRCNTGILILLQDHSTCFGYFPYPLKPVLTQPRWCDQPPDLGQFFKRTLPQSSRSNVTVSTFQQDLLLHLPEHS